MSALTSLTDSPGLWGRYAPAGASVDTPIVLPVGPAATVGYFTPTTRRLPSWNYELPAMGPSYRLSRYSDQSGQGVNVFILKDGAVTETGPDGQIVTWDDVSRTFYGGHVRYRVNSAERDLLVAAGYAIDGLSFPLEFPYVLA